MSDFATAAAAIRNKFSTAWAARTPILEENDLDNPVPPIDGNGAPVPFVFLQIQGTTEQRRGVGLPGAQVYELVGLVIVDVFVPNGYGRSEADALAVAAAKIFRDAPTFTDTGGALIQCDAPAPPNAGPLAESSSFGNQFGVRTSIPFRFFYS